MVYNSFSSQDHVSFVANSSSNFSYNGISDNNLVSQNFQGVQIVHQNIRSLRSNFNNFIAHLDSFSLLPDLLFLSEIWINDEEINLYRLDCCNNSYRSGGVLVYYRNDLNCFVETVNLLMLLR